MNLVQWSKEVLIETYKEEKAIIAECMCRSIEEKFKVKIPCTEYIESILNGKFEETRQILEKAGIKFDSMEVYVNLILVQAKCLSVDI